jgi:hypothetical protein
MSSESLEAARAVRRILSSVDDHGVVDVFSKYPPQELITSIYVLSRLQKACQAYERQNFIEHEEVTDTDLLDELTHYSKFAASAYGWTMDLATGGRLHRGDLQALVKMTGIELEDVVTVNSESRANLPAFFIVRDTARKRLVLGIRGTWSPHDLLTDLCCTSEDFTVSSRRHRAHHGMLEAARAVAELAMDIVAEDLEAHPDYSLLLVGHSLGGSVAALLGTIWEDTFPNITVYAFGAACVSPPNSTSGATIISVLGEGDPFSSLSLGHIADVSLALSQLCENPELRAIILMRTGSVKNMEERDLQWCSETMHELRESMVGDKLYPPGRLLFISRRTRDLGCRLSEVKPDFFRDLIVGPRILDLSQHVPRLYESRLRDCLLATATPLV